jgi:hypothetical protein
MPVIEVHQTIYRVPVLHMYIGVDEARMVALRSFKNPLEEASTLKETSWRTYL